MADAVNAQIAVLFDELRGAARRRRQEVAHTIALAAKARPEIVVGFVDDLLEALERPEARTRWEILDALTALIGTDPDAVAPAFDGAEESLFDESSAPLRLAAFLFLCRFGQTTPARSDQVWPLLDEAIQCYHGDAEYRDMLAALVDLSKSAASDATKKALAARVKFDAENGTGYIKTFSQEIVDSVK